MAVQRSGRIRVAIYARYSSDMQRVESIGDQIEVCRRYAEQQGWTVVATFDDAAVSGSSARLRPGFQRMVLAAEAGQFEAIVCEAVDRLGRNLSDVAGLHDRLVFRGVVVHTPSTGALTAMHIGIMGTVAQMQLSDLRDKTKRGQLGRVRAGRIPGGLAFGYEVVPPTTGAKEAGERCIDPAQADTVRRIFRDYAAGVSPRRLARALNDERVPGPGGRPWIDTTIRGQVDRGTGILSNRIYAGELAWNRCSYIKNPATGKREARLNPPEQWEHRSLPELRIVDQVLWDAVKARQAATTIAMECDGDGLSLNRTHRRRFVLSGLLKCGACSGGYSIMAKDRYGCAAHVNSGTCGNGATILRSAVERRVLGALQERMYSPELLAVFIEGYNAELAASRAEARQRGATTRTELADVQRKLTNVVDAIARVGISGSLETHLAELERRLESLQADAAIAAENDTVIPMPPAATAEMYREKVATLVEGLIDPSMAAEATEAVRSLHSKVVTQPAPNAPDRHWLGLHSDLVVALRLATGGGPLADDTSHGSGVVHGQLSVVAGTRSHLDLLLRG